MNAEQSRDHDTLVANGYKHSYGRTARGYLHNWYTPNGNCVATDKREGAAVNKAYRHYLDSQPAPIESPAQPLSELHARIAELEAENARMKDCLKRVYSIPYVQGIAIAILIEDILGLNEQAPIEAPVPDAEQVTLAEGTIEYLAKTKCGDDGYFADFLPIPTAHQPYIQFAYSGGLFTFTRITDEYNTAANRAAIEAKRQLLATDEDEDES